MPAATVRADYDALGQTAQVFGQQAENTRQTLQRVSSNLEILQGGDWVGQGATAFFSEMNGEVLPAVRRLASALDAASQALAQISQIMRQAEADAARVLRGDGAAAGEQAGVAGAGAAVGAGASAGAAGGGAVAGGGAASTTGQAGFGGNPLLVRDPKQLFSDRNMSQLVGSHFDGANTPELRAAMDSLAADPRGPGAEQALHQIAELRGKPYESIRADYDKFLQVQAQAAAIARAKGIDPIPPLSQLLHGDFMGTTPQMRYGQVVGQAFGIDPVFGALLNPTGGMVGPGNAAYAPGDDSAVGYHGEVHDAAGYLYNYHNTGPGYNYLGRESTDTGFPLTGQVSGVSYWVQKIHPSTTILFQAADAVVNVTTTPLNVLNGLMAPLGL